MRVSDAQVRKLMESFEKHGEVGKASLRAGLHRNTGRKYLQSGKLPSQSRSPRTWRTREDPFALDWEEIVERLEVAPELEARALFEDLCERYPERYEEGQLRTLQRRIKQWRAQSGPEKVLFFPQEHRPGEAMQCDFTWATELGITIEGAAFAHLLCQVVLPYSNWQWVTVCFSESMAALRRGVQSAVFRLGKVPLYFQTDNSTSATHDLRTGKRGFNEEYEALMRHLGMTPRTIQVGEKHQDGDVEALNGALKRRLEQHLLLRGHRDFESRAAYEAWLIEVIEKINRCRRRKLGEDLEAMRAVTVERLKEYREQTVRVTAWSTVRVHRHTYSVPSRLVGERVTVRSWEDRVEVLYGGQVQLKTERLRGSQTRRIDYRHLIFSLVRKPGAFARFRYREELFPQPVFRRAYDRLLEGATEYKADAEYLRILHLAASTLESEVATALELLLAEGETPSSARAQALIEMQRPAVPSVEPLEVDLTDYDTLLRFPEAVAS